MPDEKPEAKEETKPVDPVVDPAKPEDKPAEEKPAPKAKADDDIFGLQNPDAVRQWTDISGQYTLEARFVSLSDGTVRLQKANGRFVRIALDQLSPADQQFVQTRGDAVAAR
jgi:hypothetical protein